ncbi:hypothetical protein WME79_04155 [Sorangium sp. So ce726]|uniref:hypothetical protein n=1 Tax=Sorangium sp. So ce726 TaxID=3133319 RepID=UPI003F5DDCA8
MAFASTERVTNEPDEDVAAVSEEDDDWDDAALRPIHRLSDTTVAFLDRFRDAFPGVRGTFLAKNADEGISRLAVLLRRPLGTDAFSPFWYLNVSGSLPIDEFRRVDKGHVRIDSELFNVRAVHAYTSEAYWRNFVLVECEADPPIGLYPVPDQDEMRNYVNEFGYYSEEYGVSDSMVVTRAEHDDGRVFRDGKSIRLKTRLEVRYLTPVAFIVCAQASALHNPALDAERKELIKHVAAGTAAMADLVEWARQLGRYDRG